MLGLGMTGAAYVQPIACEPLAGDSVNFRLIYECLVMSRLSQKFKTAAVYHTRQSNQQNLDAFIADVRNKCADLGYSVKAADVHILGGWFT
jgi:hypothetical protein